MDLGLKGKVAVVGASNMARTGVIGFAKTLASELAPDNILINNVCPGVIFTDRIKQLATVAEEAGITYEEALTNMTQDIPLGRIGDPKEFEGAKVISQSGCTGCGLRQIR